MWFGDYFAEFIQLNSPSLDHNISLAHGQIRLTWQQPAGINNEYQIGSGYVRIECSSDVNFSSLASCQPATIPIEDLEAVLTVSDVTRPYYSRLYVVRNYNGTEIKQRRLPNIYYYANGDGVFCGGKR